MQSDDTFMFVIPHDLHFDLGHGCGVCAVRCTACDVAHFEYGPFMTLGGYCPYCGVHSRTLMLPPKHVVGPAFSDGCWLSGRLLWSVGV